VNQLDLARRWRLVLGRYADQAMGREILGPEELGLDQVLGFLYDREYAGRGHRWDDPGGQDGWTRRGGQAPPALTALTWLERGRALFPRQTFERLQTEAVQRYGLNELLADPAVAESLSPSPELGAALLALRGKLDAKLADGLRTVVAKVVEDIVARLRPVFATALSGRLNHFRLSLRPRSQDLDWRVTVRRNLSHYDIESRRLAIDRVYFNSRTARHLPWEVILCVDQSQSMAESVIYSAVVASILGGLPGVGVRLLLFDTAVVDLTDMADDPITVLMTAQLGGGTDIARAVALAETLVTRPARTVVVLISDFEEGGSVPQLLATVTRLRGAGVELLGLAALDEAAEPVYDRQIGALLADRGMKVAALTPDRLAQWLAEVMA
jgi:hypothetical protein